MARKNKKQQQSQLYADDDEETEDTIGVLSIFGHSTPVVQNFCFCFSLRTGSYIIAGLGILPTIACIILAMPPGQKVLHDNGLPKSYSPGIEWIYGFFGVDVFCMHIILCVAIAFHSRQMIVLYLWSLLAYMGGSFGIALIIAAETIKQGHVKFGVTYFSLAATYTLILLYFWIVINSELYIEKKRSNVVNIHITII